MKNSLDEIAAKIVDSLPLPQNSDSGPIPEFRPLEATIERLKEIVSPRFRCNESCKERLAEQVKQQLREAQEDLSHQIAVAIARHFEACEDMSRSNCPNEAVAVLEKPDDISVYSQGIAEQYMQSLPGIQMSLVTDVKAAFWGDPACKNFDEVILCYPGLHAVTIHRLAHELYRLKVPFLPRMMSEWVHSKTGVDIHPGAQIGDHFFIDHGTGVVIGETCEIGEHVKIYQGVTLGALSFPEDEMGQLIRDSKRHPTIEGNVVIYANATVLGGTTVVGNNSVIGSSVWLTHSVAPATTVTMKKPKLRLRNPEELSGIHDFQI